MTTCGLDDVRATQSFCSAWAGQQSGTPRLVFRLSGVFLLRFADRQFLALLLQLPPRFTRLEPDEGPVAITR